jgi:hypothetical protein
LNTDVGKLSIEARQLDDTVLALGTGGDGVDDVELDDLANEQLTEELAGLESVGLRWCLY